MEEQAIELKVTNLSMTNKRIWYQNDLLFQSILLQSVASIEVKDDTKYLYLTLSIILAIVSLPFVMNMGIVTLTLILLAIFSYYRYYSSKKTVMIISSKGGGQINIPIKKGSFSTVIKEMNLIEQKIITAADETKELRNRMMGLMQENAMLKSKK